MDQKDILLPPAVFAKLSPPAERWAWEKLRSILNDALREFCDVLFGASCDLLAFGAYPSKLSSVSKNGNVYQETSAKIGCVSVYMYHCINEVEESVKTSRIGVITKIRIPNLGEHGTVRENMELFERVDSWWDQSDDRWIAHWKPRRKDPSSIESVITKYGAILYTYLANNKSNIIDAKKIIEICEFLRPVVQVCLADQLKNAKKTASLLAGYEQVRLEVPRRDEWIIERRDVVEHIVGSLWSRPLVLLAGISGSGKSQVAKILGQALAESPSAWEATNGKPAVDAIYSWLQQTDHVDEGEDGWCRLLVPKPRSETMGLVRPGMVADEADQSELDAVDGECEEGTEDGEEPEEGTENDAGEEDGASGSRVRDVPGRRFAFVPVRPDWHEASCLWGYCDPKENIFRGTPALEVVLDAWRTRNSHTGQLSHFLVLDEMNLSRLEYYGSDLLSAMEQPGMDVIHLHAQGHAVPLAGVDGVLVPSKIGWAPGLRVIGTVNVDETTFSFAPKVLDRAAILEFVDVDLERAFVAWDRQQQWDRLAPWFVAVQAATRPHVLHLGYRAAREIADVIVGHLGADAGQWPPERLSALLDLQLRNKVLSRVRGPRGTAEPVLLDLLALAAGGLDVALCKSAREKLRIWSEEGCAGSFTEKVSATPHFPDSTAKGLHMLEKLRGIGFTGFF